LRSLRHLQIDAAAERRHAHGLAERRLPRRDRQIEPNIAPLGAEPAVRQQSNLEEQVAGWTAADAGLALRRHPDALAVDDTGRNADRELLRRRLRAAALVDGDALQR